VLTAVSALHAHDGPPYPIVSGQVSGPYRISVWTDPDTTDDGSAGGQFWVILERASGEAAVPADTSVTVAAKPLTRPGGEQQVRAEPTGSDAARQFAGVVLDHEGRFAVRVTVTGSLGESRVDAEVDATYDLRPPPVMLAVYLMPFVLVGALWIKLLLRRRGASAGAGRHAT
jgi:hypothetical protein